MTGHQIDADQWRDALATNQRVAVVGRSLLLGVIAGFAAGGLGAAVLVGWDWLDGALFLGGLIGAVVGLVFGGTLSPMVLKRAQATSGVASKRDRVAFAASAVAPAAAGWFAMGTGIGWGTLAIGIVLSFLLAAAVVAMMLGWCMKPLTPRPPDGAAAS